MTSPYPLLGHLVPLRQVPSPVALSKATFSTHSLGTRIPKNELLTFLLCAHHPGLISLLTVMIVS